MSTALDRIIDYKCEEVRDLKSRTTIGDLERLATEAPSSSPRGFIAAISQHLGEGRNALICELKRKSPSAGDILPDADRLAIAEQYQHGGATCISVLTDGPSFGGSLDDLKMVRERISIPVIRKDFMVDPIQVTETHAHGADAILVILSAVDDATALDLIAAARQYDLDVLVEVHDRDELERALQMPVTLVGVNNRDLKRMVTDLGTTETLAHLMPPDRILVSESGISTVEDIKRLKPFGARTFLIGEALMKRTDRENAVRALSEA